MTFFTPAYLAQSMSSFEFQVTAYLLNPSLSSKRTQQVWTKASQPLSCLTKWSRLKVRGTSSIWGEFIFQSLLGWLVRLRMEAPFLSTFSATYLPVKEWAPVIAILIIKFNRQVCYIMNITLLRDKILSDIQFFLPIKCQKSDTLFSSPPEFQHFKATISGRYRPNPSNQRRPSFLNRQLRNRTIIYRTSIEHFFVRTQLSSYETGIVSNLVLPYFFLIIANTLIYRELRLPRLITHAVGDFQFASPSFSLQLAEIFLIFSFVVLTKKSKQQYELFCFPNNRNPSKAILSKLASPILHLLAGSPQKPLSSRTSKDKISLNTVVTFYKNSKRVVCVEV